MPDLSAHSDSAAWYCIRTQTKREYLASQTINQLDGVQSFCPRIRYRKATRRGKVWWVEAMFPGYIFAFFDRLENERNLIHCRGVMKLLKFGNHVPEIPASFVAELIKQMEDEEEGESDMLTLAPTVSEGDEVELANGALEGFQGTVVEVLPSIERVKLLVEFLGDSQIIDVDLYSLLLPNKPLPEEGPAS
ncbi:MAG: transcription termination/antitermination protein NusG [Akkermansiaceae bacterium]